MLAGQTDLKQEGLTWSVLIEKLSWRVSAEQVGVSR